MINQFPRFKGRILFSGQALNLESDDHFNLATTKELFQDFKQTKLQWWSSNISDSQLDIPAHPLDILNNSWILLIIVQTNKRFGEVFVV